MTSPFHELILHSRKSPKLSASDSVPSLRAMTRRLHILLVTVTTFLLASRSVQGVELVFLEWEHGATVNQDPLDNTKCEVGATLQHPQAPHATLAAELIHESDCSATILSHGLADSDNVDTSDPFTDQFGIRSLSAAIVSSPSVVGTVPGRKVSQVRALSIARFDNNASGSGGLFHSVAVEYSSSFDTPVKFGRSVEMRSVGVFDTDIDPGVDISSRDIRLMISSERDGRRRDLDWLTIAAEVFDHDSGDSLWSSELKAIGRTETVIPFRERLGHQVRVEVSVVGSVGVDSMPPGARGRESVRLHTSLFVPEPEWNLIHLFGCISLVQSIVRSKLNAA